MAIATSPWPYALFRPLRAETIGQKRSRVFLQLSKRRERGVSCSLAHRSRRDHRLPEFETLMRCTGHRPRAPRNAARPNRVTAKSSWRTLVPSQRSRPSLPILKTESWRCRLAVPLQQPSEDLRPIWREQGRGPPHPFSPTDTLRRTDPLRSADYKRFIAGAGMS
jgi:hypothetical protein